MLGQPLQWPKQTELLFARPKMLLRTTETFSPLVVRYSLAKLRLAFRTGLTPAQLVALQWRPSVVLKTGPRQTVAKFSLVTWGRLLRTFPSELLQKL